MGNIRCDQGSSQRRPKAEGGENAERTSENPGIKAGLHPIIVITLMVAVVNA